MRTTTRIVIEKAESDEAQTVDTRKRGSGYSASMSEPMKKPTTFDKCLANGDCSGAKQALKSLATEGRKAVNDLKAAGHKDLAKKVAADVKASLATGKKKLTGPCKIKKRAPKKQPPTGE